MEVRTMFSYEDYKEIIRIIQSTGNQAGYEEALTADKFVIMRHDVEYLSLIHISEPTRP